MASNYWKCGKCRKSNQYWNRKCEKCNTRKPKNDDSDDDSFSKSSRRKNGYTSSKTDHERTKYEKGPRTSRTGGVGRRRRSSSPKRDSSLSRERRDKWKQKDAGDRRHSCSPRRNDSSSHSRKSGRKTRRDSFSGSSSAGDSDSDDYNSKTGQPKPSRHRKHRHRDDDDDDDDDDEIRIVLLGKTGSGKSATGNTILKGDYFDSVVSGKSVTKKCKRGNAKRFGKSIHVIDTPGVFDTSTPPDIVTKEIVKCIGIASPGPHAFILVVRVGRFTKEEYESVEHFIETFGEDAYDYMIVLFTRKDDLDHGNVTLKEHIKTVPKSLKTVLKNCSNRCIAFNNRAGGRENNEQVEELLDMLEDLKRKNHGDYYTNEMFDRAEKLMQEREDEIRKEEKEEIDKERRRIEKEVERKYRQEISRHVDLQQDLEIRIAELESKQSSKKGAMKSKREKIEKEIKDLKRQISRDKKAGKNTKMLVKKLDDLELEKETYDRDEGKEDVKSRQEVDELRKELENMRQHSQELEKDRDRQLSKKLKEHERKLKELERKKGTRAHRNKARDEVEKEETSLGDKILNGITKIGKAIFSLFM